MQRFIPLVFFTAVGSAMANSILVDLGRALPTLSGTSIVMVGIFIILAVGGLVAWEIFLTDKKQREKLDTSWQAFNEIIKKKRLGSEEIDILRELVISGRLPEADLVFVAPGLFEKCVEAWISRQEARRVADIPYDRVQRIRDRLGFTRLPIEVHLTSTRQIPEGMRVQFRVGGPEGLAIGRGAVVSPSEEHLMLDLEEEMPLRAGSELFLWFIRNGDAEYSLMTSIKRVVAKRLVIQHAFKLERKQLRNWVRIDVNLPCRVSVIRPGEVAAGQAAPAGGPLEGRILDISGGGMCMRGGVQIPKNSILAFDFDLPGSTFRGLQAEVINIIPAREPNVGLFIHRLRFVEIDTPQQEKIVRFVFEKSRMDSILRP